MRGDAVIKRCAAGSGQDWSCLGNPKGHGLCAAHLWQQKQGYEFTALEPRRKKAPRKCTVVVDGVRCTKPHDATGFCRGHRMQHYRGQEPGFLKPRNNEKREGEKWCPACCEWLSLDEFNKNRRDERPNSDGLHHWCRECSRWKNKMRHYNLTKEQFVALLAGQGDACAICGTTEPGGRGWHVDHDHKCCETNARSCGKCVRGLLCGACNVGMGNLGDDPIRLLAAADYLLFHSNIPTTVER